MAVIDKRINIFPGDTLAIAFECRKPDTLDPLEYQRGQPVTPDSAYVRVKDQDDVWFELGGVGIEEAPMTIVPQTGNTYSDTGAIIKYTLPAIWTLVPGNYTIFATATFSDGLIRTEDKKFRVLEFR